MHPRFGSVNHVQFCPFHVNFYQSIASIVFRQRIESGNSIGNRPPDKCFHDFDFDVLRIFRGDTVLQLDDLIGLGFKTDDFSCLLQSAKGGGEPNVK